MATPAVIGVAGTIVGTSCAVYGASEMGEGAGLFYLAEQGDIYTQPFNPIRNTVFCGNQGLYDGWGQANLFVAGVLISGSSTVNDLGATTINREVAVEVTKEVTKDMVLGGLSDHVVSSGVDFAQKKFGFNNTTALLFDIGAGLTTDKVINGPISKTIEVESGKLKGVDIDQRVPEISGGESGTVTDMTIMSRNSGRGNPGRGNPSAITHFDVDLNTRQKNLLQQLPNCDSSIIIKKGDVNLKDLAALTTKTGDEFAMFTRGSQRMIIRGNASAVNIDGTMAQELYNAGFKWSGHTHPGNGINVKFASEGDIYILEQFNQTQSVIFDSQGNFSVFEIGE